MRRDMQKVIVERPRGGMRGCFRYRRSKFERATRDRSDPDVMRTSMPMRFERTKYLNENLAPLKRFVQRRIGKRWDNVYAELRAHLAPKRAIDMHVLQHLYDYVAFARHEPDGVWLYEREGRAIGPLAGIETAQRWRRPLAYVCCDTGVLKRTPRKARRVKKKRTRRTERGS